MKFQNKYRIESTRLQYWDYSNPGLYFVTICTKNFVEWFGKIEDGEMELNEYGIVAEKCWVAIPEHFENVELDEFIIMPNHIHGIVGIDGEYFRGRDVACNVSTSKQMSNISPKPGSLSAIIRSYKSAVTRNIRKYHNPNFAWQPRFYDHIIRTKTALENIQNYIKQNPANWKKDQNSIDEDNSFIKKMKQIP